VTSYVTRVDYGTLYSHDGLSIAIPRPISPLAWMGYSRQNFLRLRFVSTLAFGLGSDPVLFPLLLHVASRLRGQKSTMALQSNDTAQSSHYATQYSIYLFVHRGSIHCLDFLNAPRCLRVTTALGNHAGRTCERLGLGRYNSMSGGEGGWRRCRRG